MEEWQTDANREKGKNSERLVGLVIWKIIAAQNVRANSRNQTNWGRHLFIYEIKIIDLWRSHVLFFQLLVVAEGEIQKQQKYYVGFISGLSRDFR